MEVRLKKRSRARFASAALFTLTAAALALTAAPAAAANLGVSPTLVAVTAGNSSAGALVAGVRVRNGAAVQAVSVQARVVRWHQDATGDVYEPAEAVVASPPVTRIAPGAENLIRIVRTATQPVAGEESYRLLLDELPEPGEAAQGGVVSMLIRHSVPVFFSASRAAPGQARWQIARVVGSRAASDGWRVVVENRGDKRLRLADLELLDANGTQVGERAGLVGYVLGASRREFVVKAAAGDASAPAALRIVAQTESGLLETELLPVQSP